ncbi:unnamed protein product [Didymodactylos carnosus]|uniref:Uncharacterized protein n=1 Tax=Didymodactylos carnosus TaxID=1234261 RepID=A0A8S2JXT9_9BILA|nr:unnamed protein product [Didymodactylos carnosus]CAF3828375.1 unnamed protein product [Didymodactylos carnosus]
MVLWYGFLAIETTQANRSEQQQHREKCLTYDNLFMINDNNKLRGKINRSDFNLTMSSSPSKNSWIYTKDLKKRFEERYLTLDDLKSIPNCRYIIVPIYCERRPTQSKLSSSIGEQNSWIYTKSFREHLVNKQQLFNNRHSLLTLFESSTTKSNNNRYCTNHGYTHDIDDCSNRTKGKMSLFRTSEPNLCLSEKNKKVQSKTCVELVEEENEDETNDSAVNTVFSPLIKTSLLTSMPQQQYSSPTSKRSTKMTRLRKLFFKSKSYQDNQINT